MKSEWRRGNGRKGCAMVAMRATRRWWQGVAALLVATAVMGSWAATPGPVAAQTGFAQTGFAPTYDQAVGQLRLYVRYINERDFTRAYNLRGSGLRSRIFLAPFANQFTGVNQSEINILGTAPTGDETVVYVKLVSIYADGTSRVLQGEYVVGFEGGRPRIFDARLRVNGAKIFGTLNGDDDGFMG